MRAAGVQTAPGMYFASIETISACSATRYGIADVPRLEDAHPAEDEDEVVGGDRREPEGEEAGTRVLEQWACLRPLVAHGPDAERDRSGDERQLEPLHQARMSPR